MAISQGFNSNSITDVFIAGFVEEQQNPGARANRKKINEAYGKALDRLGDDLFSDEDTREMAKLSGVVQNLPPKTSLFGNM